MASEAPIPTVVGVDQSVIARARPRQTATIVVAGVVTLLALAALAWLVVDRFGSWFTFGLLGAVVLAGVVLIVQVARRRSLMDAVAAAGVVATIDEHGVALGGLPAIPWSAMLYASVLDDRERMARRDRLPFIGALTDAARGAGSGVIGVDIGVRSAESLRDAAPQTAIRRLVSLGMPLDGHRRGNVFVVIDAYLSPARGIEVADQVLRAAGRRGVPAKWCRGGMEWIGFRLPFLDDREAP